MRRVWLAVSIAISAIAGAAGCFNPHVLPGTVKCAPSGKACPDGLVCGAGDLCVRPGDTGTGGGGGHPGSGGSGGSGDTGGASGTGGATALGQVGQTCLIRNEGQSDQSDTCDVGLLCLNDCASARCYKICQADADCSQSACTRADSTGTRRLCEVPYAACNPQDTATGGCGQGLVCILLSADPSPSGGDRTVCDCSAATSGRGEPCTATRSCFPGLVCPPLGSGPGAEYCRVVCDPAVGCPSGGTCHPYGAKWGYCF